MVDEREPRWENSAHLKIQIPRGRSARRSADELTTLVRWTRALPDATYCPKTWLTPTATGELDRAGRDCELFGLAGIELRSDLFAVPNDSLEASHSETLEDCPVLASLRTDEPEWLARMDDTVGVAAADVDVQHLTATLESGVLESVSPRRIVVSTHPTAPSDESIEALLAAGNDVAESGIVPRDHIVLKYAPHIGAINQVDKMWTHRQQVIDEGWEVTVLPQGPDYRWCRPILARTNATNYMPVGFDGLRRHPADPDPRPPFDLQRWLPHLVGPTPEAFDGLIGSPVEHSQGDVWHRRAALSDDSDGVPHSYLKIPFRAAQEGASEGGLDAPLRTLHRLGIHGLSVTSPLKRMVTDVPVVDGNGLEAANTLTRTDCEGDDALWRAADTDADGMHECLLNLEEEYDIGPGEVALIGTGGVAPAIVRAIEASDWTLVAHARGRDGWSDVSTDRADLVVNAAGDHDPPYEDPPTSTAWLDLHYWHVRQPPEGTQVHLIGDVFFDGQAAAQRRIWAT